MLSSVTQRPRVRSMFGAAGLIAALAAPSRASIRSGSWTGDFSIPAFDGAVSAAAIRGGRYYVAGDFHWAGGVRARDVAVWTGSAWAQVANGLPLPVRRLAVWGTSLLAATSSGLAESGPVMKYDGAAWVPLGPQLYGEADALLIDGPDVYVGGSLLQPGLTNDNRVLRWDGNAWQPIGGGFDGRIFALAIYQGDLYAGGEFLFAEGNYVSRIARWDGAHWQPVGGGTNAGGGVAVNALAVYGGRLVAGGYLSALGGVSVRGIGAWNGAEWDSLPETPKDCFVNDLQAEGNLLHVAGVIQVPNQWGSGVATFDGQTWRPPIPYPDGGIQDLAIGDGKLIAVGSPSVLCDQTPCASPSPVRNVVVRDPTFQPLFPWTDSMRGLLGPSWTEVMALHVHRGELYAGGYFWDAAAPPAWNPTGALVRWTGDGWARVGDGSMGGWVQKIGSYGDQLVVGSTGSVASGTARTSVLAWDGAKWGDLGGSLEGSVRGLTEWEGALVAAGSVRLPGQTDWSAVAIHQDAGWKILGEPLITNQYFVEDAATFHGELYVAGAALNASGGTYTLVRWSSDHWAPIPDTPVGVPRSLLPRQDGLWVGLSLFTGSTGSVWRWDGASWTQMGFLAGDVIDLTEAGGDVFASGSMVVDGVPAALARWDGSRWIAVTDGPDRPIETMASLGNDLYVGGAFTRTGLGQTEGLARWSFQTDAAPVSIQSISSWPSPARDHITFRFALAREGRALVTLYDLKGARVATPVDEVLPAGYSERGWSIPSDRMPPGVYFVHLQAAGESWSQKILIVR